MLFSITAVKARLLDKDWTYQEMLDKSDLVIIGKPTSTNDTSERITIPGISPELRAIGVNSEFAVRLVLKGNREVHKIVLHHYRLERIELIVNGPELVSFDTKNPSAFLLFLTKEPDGRYAPVTGQTDPGIFSVLKLESIAE